MIGLLQGILYRKNPGFFIIMVHGVGYKVEPVASLYALEEGTEITVYMYTYVREDAIKLFGFATESELQMFEHVLGVSGIGPKGAMNILSVLGVDGVISAVQGGNVKAFTKVSGIGLKNAQKVIIELASKLKHYVPYGDVTTNMEKDELEEALQALGYSQGEIKSAIESIHIEESIATNIRNALQSLQKKR